MCILIKSEHAVYNSNYNAWRTASEDHHLGVQYIQKTSSISPSHLLLSDNQLLLDVFALSCEKTRIA